MTIPTRLQSHLLRKHSRPQLILLAEVYKPHASLFQALDQLNHIGLGLILHRHHSDEHLMALHFEATLNVRTILLLVVVLMMMLMQEMWITMGSGNRASSFLVRIGGLMGVGRGEEEGIGADRLVEWWKGAGRIVCEGGRRTVIVAEAEARFGR